MNYFLQSYTKLKAFVSFLFFYFRNNRFSRFVVNILKKIDKTTYFILIFLLIFNIFLNLLTINRWFQFEYYYFDHGIFSQSLWSVSRGRPPLFDHIGNHQLNQFGDHFTPSLYLLAPVFWISDSYLSLIILQNLLICCSFFVLFLIGKKLKVSVFLNLAIIFSLSIFVGFQNGVISGFHTEFPALLTMGMTFLFFEKKKYAKSLLFLLITLGFKETLVVLVAVFGWLFFIRKQRALGVALVLFAVGYYFFATHLIVPLISGEKYGYQLPNKSALDLINSFFFPEMKIKTMLMSLANFGFLAMFSGWYLLLIIQEFFIRFSFTSGTHSWDLGMHYNLVSAYLLAYLSLVGSVRVQSKLGWRFMTGYAFLIFFSSIVMNYKLNTPLLMVINKDFYQQSKNLVFLSDFIEKIPKKGLVMSQNNLIVRMTHNNSDYFPMLLRENYWDYMPDIIALDLRDGQSANNYWPADVYVMFESLQDDPNYNKHVVFDEQLYFAKNNNVDMDYYLKYKIDP